MYLALGMVSGVAGYFFYRWRGSISLEKEHRDRRAKKLSHMKLLWGFLFMTTLPGILSLWMALAWRGNWMTSNILATALLCFAAGGLIRFPLTMRTFRAKWPKETEEEKALGKPRSAA